MGLTPQDRYRVAKNIIARKGIEGINLHAELAKAEATVNFMDAQGSLNAPVSSPESDAGTFIPTEGLDTTQGEIMPENSVI